jgi:hypothetical protein
MNVVQMTTDKSRMYACHAGRKSDVLYMPELSKAVETPVYCAGEAPYLGFFDGTNIILNGTICAMIKHIRSGSADDGGAALLILGHEEGHAKGLRDELKASCYGLRQVKPLSRKLGASKQRAKALRGVAYDYVGEECRK